MARHSVVSTQDLDEPRVLAPERYDPRRRLPSVGTPLSSVAKLATESFHPSALAPSVLVLDTTHAVEGLVRTHRSPMPGRDVRSSKKILLAGDVIVSRLRPYLRQVAWIDPQIAASADLLLASPEFYVLRSVDGRSIAFLVPYLLSSPVQGALAAAQEGGHHPRVPRSFVQDLTVPDAWMARRDAATADLERAANGVRSANACVHALVEQAETAYEV